MGFDVAQVISDDKHYSPFLCGVCQNLVSLDAVVTQCSHPFCRDCLEGWCDSQQAVPNNMSGGCPCPACHVDISSSNANSMVLGKMNVAALPLYEAQPLAYQVLILVQVACIDRIDRQHCEWSGDYGDFIEHADCHGADCASKSFVSGVAPDIKHLNTRPADGRPSMKDFRSLSTPSVMYPKEGDNDNSDDDTPTQVSRKKIQANKQRPPETPGPFRKAMSLRNLGRMQEQSEDSSDEMLSVSQSAAMPDTGNASNASPPEARKDKESNGAAPISPTNPHKDAPPAMVQRTFSEDGSFAGNGIRFQKPNRPKKRKPPVTGGARYYDDREDDRGEDLDASHSQSSDWNSSMNSNLNNSNHFNREQEQMHMETLEEDEPTDFALEYETESTDTGHSEKRKKTMDKAEKLKKQANAKFNKGDFEAARILYTDGINVMSAITAVNVKERDLLSNMHSNRAVTFFREKHFDKCIADCDKAIDYDPTYDKSWIRKWRALMALGSFDAAYECLQAAAESIPDSKRILQEFNKSTGDKQILDDARAALDKEEYEKVRDMLKPYALNSDNLGLLMLAARADAGLGNTESALEKVNKALRFNPTHTEGLEVRGHILFLTGETEKGAHLLQDAYGRNRDNRSVRLELMRCQKTHSSLSKGRSCVKRGRYMEAVEHFSTAIKESGRVPLRAPLFGQLRTERAEAFLLSRKHMEALRDCQEVLNAQEENATAWSVRAEILIALGKADEAKRELEIIRNSWGADNPTIDEGYRRVDFELRVLKEDDELMRFVEDLESGNPERLLFETVDRKAVARKSYRRARSSVEHEDEPSPRSDKDNRRPNRIRPSSEAPRRKGGRSKSRPRKYEHENGRSEKVERTQSGSTRGPPSMDHLTNGMEDGKQSERKAVVGKENKRRPNAERQGFVDPGARTPQSAKRS